MKVLRRLAASSIAFPIICEALNEDPELFDGLVTLFIYGLSDKGKNQNNLQKKYGEIYSSLSFKISDINISIMRFITDLLILCQSSNYNFVTLADHLNEVPLTAHVKESTRKFIFNTDIISQSVVNWLESSDSDEICSAEILYGQLANLFERFNDTSQIKQIPVRNREKCYAATCKALETLLKCSDKARKIATKERFLLSIVVQMENISANVGGSFTDFIRRNGNAKVGFSIHLSVFM